MDLCKKNPFEVKLIDIIFWHHNQILLWADFNGASIFKADSLVCISITKFNVPALPLKADAHCLGMTDCSYAPSLENKHLFDLTYSTVGLFCLDADKCIQNPYIFLRVTDASLGRMLSKYLCRCSDVSLVEKGKSLFHNN